MREELAGTEFKKLESEVYQTFEEIKRFAVGLLGFYRKDGEDLKINYCLVGEKKVPESYFEFEDEKIYLDINSLKNSQRREKAGRIFSFFYPFAFVLEETQYGSWLKEEVKKGVNVPVYPLLGIGKVVELDAAKALGYTDEEKDDLKLLEEKYSLAYDFYITTRKLQDLASRFSGDINEEARPRIIKAALLAAGKDQNFDFNYKQLTALPVEKIYEMAGAEITRPEILEKLKTLAKEIKRMSLEQYQWRYVKPLADRMGKELSLKGFPPDIREKFSLLYENWRSMERTEPFKEELLKPTRDFIDEILDYCGLVEERPIRIRFY